MIDENAEPPEDSPADTPDPAVDLTASTGTASAEARAAEPVAAAAPEPDLEEDEEDDEPVAPRVKPAIPGADLEVDIVAEGADPLAQLDEEAQAAADADDEVRVTVIATGFDRLGGGPSRRREEIRRSRRDRDVTLDDRQRSSLEISDDEIEIPPFLR